MPRRWLVPIVLVVALAASGCARKDPVSEPNQPALLQPQRSALKNLGFPEIATKNTTRVSSTDPTRIAAGVMRAVYPNAQRPPKAISLVATSDWRVAVSAAALMGPPINAPVLFSDSGDVPAPTREVLDALRPPGSKSAGGASIIRVGNVAVPSGYKVKALEGATPLALTRAIARLLVTAQNTTSPDVIVASADEPAFAAPAAGYAAKTGTPVLFVHRTSIPPETRAALAALARPRIFLLGPSQVVSPKVRADLARIGTVQRYGASRDPKNSPALDAVRNSIAAARFIQGNFGWGVIDPGHGLVFARAGQPLIAAAAAPLSASGTYGPLLLLDDADQIADVLEGYLLDIQPAYSTDPVRGLYNRGWVIGDRDAISLSAQARLDRLLEIGPVSSPDNPPQP
jgi:hypothetical protein